MKVSEIMTKAAVNETASDTLAQASQRMHEQQTGSLLVMEGDELIGIVTERDLLKCVARGLDPAQTPIKDIMTTDLITIEPNTSLKEAAKLMATKWIRHLPIVEHGRVVGIISQRDLTGVLAEALNEPGAMHQLLESSSLVRERRLRRIEHGDLD